MRKEVSDLVALGPWPAQESIADDDLERREQLLTTISPPVTDDEARELVTLFGPDDFYGGAWSLVHLIESAPGWPLEDALTNKDNEWIQRLRQRDQNARNTPRR
jgi:hypothetical protein